MDSIGVDSIRIDSTGVDSITVDSIRVGAQRQDPLITITDARMMIILSISPWDGT